MRKLIENVLYTGMANMIFKCLKYITLIGLITNSREITNPHFIKCASEESKFDCSSIIFG